MTAQVWQGARVVMPEGVLDGGWVAIDGELIAGVGTGAPPTPGVDLHGRWLVPGFVDLHVHGGGGHAFTGDLDAARGAVAFHQRHGTTSTLLSLVTMPPDALVAATASLAALVDGRQVVGLHLEGPFLSEARSGALDPRWMTDPDHRLADRLIEAGRDTVRVMTVAPERAGGVELIGRLARAGIVAAFGHTDATYDDVRRAIAAGATLATHVCNGMRPWHHREPGAVGAALDHADVTCEAILDGHHLHPAAVRAIVAAKGVDRVALITDATEAAGAPDGSYDLGGQPVDVAGGVARLRATGTLAGSTLTMDAALRQAVEFGIPLADACRMASLVPARVLGIDAMTGSIEAGKAADLVVLDDRYQPVAVMARGRVITGADVLRSQ